MKDELTNGPVKNIIPQKLVSSELTFWRGNYVKFINSCSLADFCEFTIMQIMTFQVYDINMHVRIITRFKINSMNLKKIMNITERNSGVLLFVFVEKKINITVPTNLL